MTRLAATLEAVAPVDRGLEAPVRARLDDLTKPRGSLGRLETLALRYCLIRGEVRPAFGSIACFAFAGDHGVCAEGVSAFPPAVTPQMVRNMLAGGAAVNGLARHVGASLHVVDVGVSDPLEAAEGLIRRKVKAGTDNMASGPAMDRDEAVRALGVGIEMAEHAHAEGATVVCPGEMGIGNTTAASALLAALLPCEPEAVTGRGTGLDDAGVARKAAVVRRALEVNAVRGLAPLDVLAAVGGLEIAAIAGLALGGAARRMAVVVDGFIASAGALAACRLCPPARDYLVFGHLSEEAGHAVFFERFGERPLLDLGLRLGEGTGALLAASLLEAAFRLYDGMATFTSAGVTDRDR